MKGLMILSVQLEILVIKAGDDCRNIFKLLIKKRTVH